MSNKQRRKVLSEEEYTSTLSSIVQREYFPELPGLQKQAAVLDRREAKDFKGAVSIRRAARRLQDHEEALADQEAEKELAAAESGTREVARPLHRETVSGFHARATSEDNQEFQENLQQEVQARRSRVEAVYSNPYQALIHGPTANLIGRETPLLASDLFNPPSHNIEPAKNPKLDNVFFFAPEVSSEDDTSKMKLLKGSSDMEMMPPPICKPNSSTGAMVVSKQELVEYILTQSQDRRIEPKQTRFPTTVAVVPQRRPANGQDSSTTDYSTEASTDIDSPHIPLHQERNARAKRQKRDLETLVAMTPLIQPGRAQDASPIITWGTVSSTPMVLGRDPASSFAMPDESARDRAARVAEEKLLKRRAKPKTPTSLAMNRMSNLTPAARSLLQKSMPKGSARSAGAFSNALRKSYTPQRRKSSNRDTVARATPRANSSTAQAQGRSKVSHSSNERSKSDRNLTDGLLDLPS